MLRRLSRLARSVQSALTGKPESHQRRLRTARRDFFTHLRVESLEDRRLLTGITVEADAPSYVEGQTAWFTFTLDQPASQAFQLDLLLSGGPAGPTGYVMPIAQGQTSAHVDFPTTDNSTPNDGYNLNLAITGSSEPGATGPFDSASTQILDNDAGGGPPPGPTPEYIALTSPGALNEGQAFTLAGMVSPAASYHLVGSINWGGFVTYAGTNVDLWTNSDGSFTIPNIYFDDGISPGNGTTSDVATIVLDVSTNGSQLLAQTTATVSNVAPTGQFDLIIDTAIGGPEFGLTGIFYDPGLSDVHTVTIDWGDGSVPESFTQSQNQQCIRHHVYPRTGETFTVTVTVADDDLGQLTPPWSAEAPMYLLDLDSDADNNGAIDEADDPIEHIFPGAFVGVNADDDDEDGLADMSSLESPPIQNENDLEAFRLRWEPADRPDADGYQDWFIGLFVSPAYTYDPYIGNWVPTGAAIYGNDDKTNPIPFIQTPDGPAALWSAAGDLDLTLYLEARFAGPITMELRLLAPDIGYFPDADLVVFTAIAPQFEILTIHHGQGGKPLPDFFDEETIGAFTVANLNDTDGDNTPDIVDDVVVAYTDPEGKQRGINEVDLMRLIVKRPPGYTAGTFVTIFADGNQVRFWDSPVMEGNSYELDPFGSFRLSFIPGQTFHELWVEAIAVSSGVRDIKIEAHYGPSHDTVRATAVWAELVAYNCQTTTGIPALNAVLATEPWSNMPENSRIPAQLQQVFKGLGIRPIDDLYGVVNVIVEAWKPLPEGILDEPQVKFDIARRADSMKFNRTDGDFVSEHDAVMPDMFDGVNDDPILGIDEVGPYGGLLFSYDGPGRAGVGAEPLTSQADRKNLEEFVRVKVNKQRPQGNSNQPIGSRASAKFYWHSRDQVNVTGSGANRTATRVPGYDEIGENNDYTTNPN